MMNIFEWAAEKLRDTLPEPEQEEQEEETTIELLGEREGNEVLTYQAILAQQRKEASNTNGTL